MDASLDVVDLLELHELPGRYGDCIDGRDWDGLARIFTDDAVFDLTDLGVPLLEGLPSIRRFMDVDAEHPLTHLMTNVYVDVTPDGWRITHRVFTLMRRPKAHGEPSQR